MSERAGIWELGILDSNNNLDTDSYFTQQIILVWDLLLNSSELTP
jgi:hypothetical protein